MALLQRKLSNIFQGGPRGVQMLISIETHITCDCPGGSGPPIPPSGPAHDSYILVASSWPPPPSTGYKIRPTKPRCDPAFIIKLLAHYICHLYTVIVWIHR